MAEVNGILLLDKPAGITSNGALQKARYMLNASKAGHSGTLDPMATGLLPIGFGQGTKALPYLLDAHKRYVATIQLGQTTTTGDAEGDLLQQQTVPKLTASLIESVLSRFRGAYAQTPPMYSALKQQGQPLYKLAREGVTVAREARAIHFYRIELLAFTDDQISIQVWCSKGTYIRVLGEDIGTALGCGGHLIALRRIGVAGFDPLEDAHATTKDWCAWQHVLDKSLQSYLLPIDRALMHFEAISLSMPLINRLAQGQKISAQDVGYPLTSSAPMRCYDQDGKFYGLVKATPFQGVMLERWMN